MNFEDVILSIFLTGFGVVLGFSLAILWDSLRERRKEKKAKNRAIRSLKYEIEENQYYRHHLERIQPRDDVWRQLIWSGRTDLFEDSLYKVLEDLYRFIAGIEVDRVSNPKAISSKSNDLQNKLTEAYKDLKKAEETKSK